LLLRRLTITLFVALLVGSLALSGLYVIGSRLITDRETKTGDELPPDVPGRLLQVNGLHRVHVVEGGNGHAVLLVHGTGGTTLDWESSVFDNLAQHHHVVAVDLYGMGFSERNEHFEYGFKLWADQLAGVLDALGIERASVIGQSVGGAIAVVFAGSYPSRVTRVVSVDSAPWLPPSMLLLITPGSGELILGRSEYWPERPDQPSRYAERLRDVYEIKGTRRHLLRVIRWEFLDSRMYFSAIPRVQCPVLQVHGASDDIIPLRAAASLTRLLKNSEMVVIDGAGHYSRQDSPQRFAQEVNRFLDKPSE